MIDPSWTPKLAQMHQSHWPKKVAEAMVGFEQEWEWWTGTPLDGLNINKTADGWLIVVKTHSVSRGPLVSFIGGESLEGALHTLLETLAGGHTLVWKPDSFRKS